MNGKCVWSGLLCSFLLASGPSWATEVPQIRTLEVPRNVVFHSVSNRIDFDITLKVTVEVDDSLSDVFWLSASTQMTVRPSQISFLNHPGVQEEVKAAISRWRIELPRNLAPPSAGYRGPPVAPKTMYIVLRYRLEEAPKGENHCYSAWYCTTGYSIRQRPGRIEVTVTTTPRSIIVD